MPSSLETLPTEVLANIVDSLVGTVKVNGYPDGHLYHIEHPPLPGLDDEYWADWWYVPDYRDLYALCLTSQRLRGVAQPVLYRSFVRGYGFESFRHMDVTYPWRGHEDIRYPWERRIIPFLRTISQRPDLGAAVRTCYLPWDVVAHVTEEEAREALVGVATVRGIDLEDFLRPLCEGHSPASPSPVRDGLLIMTLACLPNLSHLYFSGNSALVLQPKILSDPGSSLHAAGVSALSIQTLAIHWRNDVEYGGFPEAVGLLEMASSTLRTLYITNGEVNLDKFAKPLPNLRNISMMEKPFMIPKSDDSIHHPYTHLVSSCGKLERLAYHGNESGREVYDETTNSRTLQALSRHQGSLKGLRIERYTFNSENSASFIPPPDLRPFLLLEDLAVDAPWIDLLLVDNGFPDLDEMEPPQSPSPADYDKLTPTFPLSLVSLRIKFQSNRPGLFLRIPTFLYAVSYFIPFLKLKSITLAEIDGSETFRNLKEYRDWPEDEHMFFDKAQMVAKAGIAVFFERHGWIRTEEGMCPLSWHWRGHHTCYGSRGYAENIAMARRDMYPWED